MDNDEIEIKEFDIQNIEPSSSWIILGPPGTGKTSFAEELVRFNRHRYPVGKVICSVPTPHKRWCKFFHPYYVLASFKKEQEEEFIEKRQKPLSTLEGIGKYCVYILDDIDVPKHKLRTPFFSDLFKQGSRHFNMLTICINQSALEFPYELRSAASYVVMFRYTSNVDRKKLYNNYGVSAYFKNEKQFNNVLNNLTGNKQCLIIKQRSDTGQFADSVFYYQLHQPMTDWTFGCQEYIDYGEKHLDRTKMYGMD
jgi:hypothetical protein